jgi:Protein of unknown function (DUF2630)
MDENTLSKINELADEEHELFAKEAAGDATDADRARLRQVEILLDQCWDLLRQRRARRDAGLDPDDAEARSTDVVEHYDDVPPGHSG